MSNSDTTTKKTFIVASHAHWDREWYSPFQEFRLRLVELVDELLDVLAKDKSGYKYFNLDGQTVVVEDYLDIRPENADKIKKLVTEGRLIIGPWYILPDEFLVSGESYVHNLLMGKEISERFGRFPNVGYLPDCFGHIAQIPQLLTGFGIDNIIFWRGLGLERPYPEIYWQGPDGTKLFGLHMVDGYGDVHTGDVSTYEAKVEKFRKMIDFYHTYGQVPLAMLMHGVDHMPIDLDVVKIMQDINADPSANAEMRHGTFEEYINELRKHQSLNWPTFKGMLRDTRLHERTGAYILNGVLSARVYMKQANIQSQMTLVRWAEPAAVMDKLFNACDRRPFLNKAWMWMLRNHPHDSIGGCSVDRVHRQMMTRFEWVMDICESIYSRTFQKLASRTSNPAEKPTYQLAVFNPMPFVVSDTIEAEITIPKGDLREMTWQDGATYYPAKAIRGVRLRKPSGQPIDAQLVGVTEKMISYPAMRELAPLRNCLVAKVRFWADDLPPMGYQKYAVELLNSPVIPTTSLLTAQNVMENAFLRVEVGLNGTLNVTDKKTGKVFNNLLYFEDGGDFGDEYTYSKPHNDEIITSLATPGQVGIAYNGPDSCTLTIEQTLSIPADLTVDGFAAGVGSDPYQKRSSQRVDMPIRTEVTLGKDSKFLRIKTTVTNQAKWHRLRAVFPTGLKADFVHAEQQYDVAEFPIRIPQPSAKVWIEDQPMQYPQQDFLDLSDGKVGLAVFNKGLAEFEVLPIESRPVAITLLRCVGYLSRSTMSARSDHAGPNLETPEAQCLGTHVFEMAVCPHKGDWVEGNVLPMSRQFAAGVKTHTPLPFLADTQKNQFSLLSLEGAGVALDACKLAERGDAVIVRMTNYSARPQRAVLSIQFPFKSVKFARLDETILPDAPKVSGTKVELQIDPKKIVTLAIQ